MLDTKQSLHPMRKTWFSLSQYNIGKYVLQEGNTKNIIIFPGFYNLFVPDPFILKDFTCFFLFFFHFQAIKTSCFPYRKAKLDYLIIFEWYKLAMMYSIIYP